MKQILVASGLPFYRASLWLPLSLAAIMMLYKNTRANIHSTDFFNIVAGMLQGDILAPYLYIIYRDYVLRMSIDLMKEYGFTLKKAKSRRYPVQTIMDADYADSIAYTRPGQIPIA